MNQEHVLFVSRRSFLITTAGAMSALAVGIRGQGKKPRRSKDGQYKIDIGGFYDGGGTATVSGQTVTLQGTVEDENGGKGQFTATGKLTNDRFEGQGTGTGGETVKIIGRVDAPTPTVPKGRISATYVTDSRRFGRLVGELTN